MVENKQFVDIVQVLDVDVNSRLKELTLPKKSMSVNALVVSSLIRSLEVTMGIVEAESFLKDSELLKRDYVGKWVAFVGDIASFTGTRVSFLNLTLVGEEVGGVIVPINIGRSNLVAESFYADLTDFDFHGLTAKLMLGSTVLFVAKVVEDNGELTLKDFSVRDFGLRLFYDDGSIDDLAVFNDLTDTYNFEYFTSRDGVLLQNEYRNTALDPYINAYRTSGDKKHLSKAVDYLIRSYDHEAERVRKSILGGMARIDSK